MFELILNCFAPIYCDGVKTLSTEDLAAWAPQDIAALKSLLLLKKATPAKVIECPGCEEACLMPVDVYPAQRERAARIFIACDKREDTGRVPVDPGSLEQWQIDIPRFASLLAAALGTGHSPDEIIPKQVFYLGLLTINRKRRTAFFITNNEALNAALETGQTEPHPNPFFLVASGLPGSQEMKQGMALPLLQILLPSENRLTVDFAELEGKLSTKSKVRLDVVPFSVPSGAEWGHVFISFVNDQTVQIKVSGIIETRSFDILGFSDLRAATTESRPSDLWGVFHQLAHLNGEATFQDSVQTFKEPEKMKKWVSQIRKKLKAIFPEIPGDPFHSYNKVKGYKTRFSLNVIPSSM